MTQYSESVEFVSNLIIVIWRTLIVTERYIGQFGQKMDKSVNEKRKLFILPQIIKVYFFFVLLLFLVKSNIK
jgi:hypothetical protein